MHIQVFTKEKKYYIIDLSQEGGKGMKITLKALRINSKLTLEEASKKIGISRETLRSYETFKTAPDLKLLPKILKVYNADINDVKFEDEEN